MNHNSAERNRIRHSTQPLEPKQRPTQEVVFPQPQAKKEITRRYQRLTGGTAYLELGAGFSLLHRPGSAYSTLYRVVAEKGQFDETAKLLESGRIDLTDALQANQLLEKMMVPVDRLEEYCKNDPVWQEHARRKTEKLKRQWRAGDFGAKHVLEDQSRSSDGNWSGHISEMLTTCVGFYNHLIGLETGFRDRSRPNKNVLKFQHASVVFRRFPLFRGGGEKQYVMMFPEKFIPHVKKAIFSARHINEDEQVRRYREAKNE
jgi:hypothetical protein